MKKSLESLEAVTHTHTHTSILNNLIARNCKTFNIPENIRNLKYNCNY